MNRRLVTVPTEEELPLPPDETEEAPAPERKRRGHSIRTFFVRCTEMVRVAVKDSSGKRSGYRTMKCGRFTGDALVRGCSDRNCPFATEDDDE